MTSKVCKHCGLKKPIDEFHKQGFNKDGTRRYNVRCAECRSELRRTKHDKYYKILPREITSDEVFKKCKMMSNDASSRVFAPSREHKKSYRNLKNPFGFESVRDMTLYLYESYYDEIKEMIDNGVSPSIDRIDTSQGYTKENIRILSHKENTQLGVNNIKKGIKVITPNDAILKFETTADCSEYFGYKRNDSRVCRWVRKCNGEDIKTDCTYPEGYYFEYLDQ